MTISGGGLARRGLLVRHLVMPGGLAETQQIMKFLARKISPATYVNVMPQYRPCGRIEGISKLTRSLSGEAYQKAIQAALDAGLTRLDPPRPFLRLR
jgi:putative pyruvate formate lyase activating enzyme